MIHVLDDDTLGIVKRPYCIFKRDTVPYPVLLILGFIPFIFYLPRFPVWVFILYNILRDALNGWLEQQMQAAGTYYSFVNSFAHLSGIIAGMVCIYLFLPPAMLHFRRRAGA